MLIASMLAHMGLGIVLALFFVIYYVNSEGKTKIFFELLLGLGGNAGAIFILYKTFNIADVYINLISIATCLFAFLVATIVFTILFAFMIKDHENNERQIIRLRDIIVGQTSWVKKFRDKRISEIDNGLNYKDLKQKENNIKQEEKKVNDKKKFIDEEMSKLEHIGNKKIKLNLPEKSNIIISKEFIDLMPSYFKDVVRCIIDMNTLEQEYLDNQEINLNTLKSYLYAISSSISSNIFSGNSADIRIHFRYYDKQEEGYKKLIAIKGSQLIMGNMTVIPCKEDNMISKSYECKRALIKSINTSYDFEGDNHAIWKDYLTYTFLNLKVDDIPFLSFGISLKNETRYKKLFYYLNYIYFFEEYLQEKIELLDNKFDLKYILYKGE